MSSREPRGQSRRDFCKYTALGWMAGLATSGTEIPVFARQTKGRRIFSHPDRIRYDRLSLYVENQPFFLYSGSFHYCRAPKELWPARFEKIRDAGFNTVQTYTPWNLHEPRMPNGPDDFSQCDMTLLDEFLTMATQFGLYTIVRCGPYMCGEWDTGGYPQWLIPKIPPHHRGMWLRSNAASYTPWANHWMQAVCRTIARHQINRKPAGTKGVLLMQVENEYGLIGVPLNEKKSHLQDLIDQARGNGIEVPLFTNLAGFILGSHDRLTDEVFDTLDRYPGWQFPAMLHRIKHYRNGQPDAPVMAAEMQGGYFTSVGATPYLQTDHDTYADNVGPDQINALTLFSIRHGMTALNYYMLFGGTNFGGRAGANVATTYDYCAPIRENGGVGAKWLKVAAIGKMIQRHGPALARSIETAVRVDRLPRNIEIGARRSPDGAHFIFIRNADRARAAAVRMEAQIAGLGRVGLSVRLARADFQVLYLPPGEVRPALGEWLPPKVAPLRRPRAIPDAVVITSVRMAPDSQPQNFRPVPEGHSLAAMGIYESGFTYYRGRVHVNRESPTGAASITAQLNSQDSATALISGHVIYPASRTGSPAIFPLPEAPVNGAIDALFVYENAGHPNSGYGLQSTFGITNIGLAPTQTVADSLDHWRFKQVKLPRNIRDLAEIKPDYSDADWHMAHTANMHPHEIGHRQSAVFRTRFNMTEADARHGRGLLRFGLVSSRAWVFVNGKAAGMVGGIGPTLNIGPLLHRGENTIALVVQELGHWGGIGEPAIIAQPDTWGRLTGHLEVATGPTGEALGWQKPEFNDAQWSHHQLPSAVAPQESPLTWFRMAFTLPQVAAGIWVPWCLKLSASGNGFIYLNGHNIGRIWEHGGQREFFLPDCWLNATGKTNTIALCLRSVDKPAGLQAATVAPYRVYAEYKKEM